MNIAGIYNHLPEGIKTKIFPLYKYIPGRRKIVKKEIDGISYELDLSERIQASIYYYGCFEKETTELINRVTKSGMTVIDVGANIGCHTFRFAKLVGETGKVYAFEPMSHAFKKLKRNNELNTFNNIIFEKLGVSDKEEEKKIFFTTEWSLLGECTDGEPENIKFTTIDNYFENKRVDIIKIDVDGYETEVIKGGRKTIKKCKPEIIIEICGDAHKKFGKDIGNLIDELEYIGYTCFDEVTGEHLSFKKIRELSVGTVNVLCKR